MKINDKYLIKLVALWTSIHFTVASMYAYSGQAQDFTLGELLIYTSIFGLGMTIFIEKAYKEASNG